MTDEIKKLIIGVQLLTAEHMMYGLHSHHLQQREQFADQIEAATAAGIVTKYEVDVIWNEWESKRKRWEVIYSKMDEYDTSAKHLTLTAEEDADWKEYTRTYKMTGEYIKW